MRSAFPLMEPVEEFVTGMKHKEIKQKKCGHLLCIFLYVIMAKVLQNLNMGALLSGHHIISILRTGRSGVVVLMCRSPSLSGGGATTPDREGDLLTKKLQKKAQEWA